MAFLTAASLSMLVSLFSGDSDTNKYTNKIAGYQQTEAHYGEGQTPQISRYSGAIMNDGE
ncbi:MAG: hypothetical protein WAV38_08610 [Xanthobacteraceae bacterium]